MEGHVHVSVVSVAGIAAVCVLTIFFLHMAALRLSASENENMQKWGAALAAGWG